MQYTLNILQNLFEKKKKLKDNFVNNMESINTGQIKKTHTHQFTLESLATYCFLTSGANF